MAVFPQFLYSPLLVVSGGTPLSKFYMLIFVSNQHISKSHEGVEDCGGTYEPKSAGLISGQKRCASFSKLNKGIKLGVGRESYTFLASLKDIFVLDCLDQSRRNNGIGQYMVFGLNFPPLRQEKKGFYRGAVICHIMQ